MAANSVPARLSDACADVAPAGPADEVAGTPARLVAAPATTAEAAAVLRAAAELGLTVVPRGSGSRLDWGAAPDSCDLIIDTRRLGQVLEHAAGDLVVSVQAGLTLEALGRVVAQAGQRLALDPPGGGTAGGVLATQAAGPLRFRYGAPRDLLIGITIVRPDGIVAKSGGKVVKNVAGYDIGKLFAGSYGTLGLITEAIFRLHPAPSATAVVTLDCPDPQSAQAAVEAVASSPLAPSAVELSWPSANAPLAVAVLLEGDDDSVTGRADRMLALLGRRATAGRPAQAADGHGQPKNTSTLLQVGFWAGQLASVLTAIRTAAIAEDLDPAVGGSAAAGMLQVEISGEAPSDAVARFVAGLRAGLAGRTVGRVPPAAASAVVRRAPADVREAVDMWGPVSSLELMRAVKEQFDPERRMAPGRFAGGI